MRKFAAGKAFGLDRPTKNSNISFIDTGEKSMSKRVDGYAHLSSFPLQANKLQELRT